MLFHGHALFGNRHGPARQQRSGGELAAARMKAVNIWQVPFFGHNEKEMVVIGKDGVFMTKTAGGNLDANMWPILSRRKETLPLVQIGLAATPGIRVRQHPLCIGNGKPSI